MVSDKSYRYNPTTVVAVAWWDSAIGMDDEDPGYRKKKGAAPIPPTIIR